MSSKYVFWSRIYANVFLLLSAHVAADVTNHMSFYCLTRSLHKNKLWFQPNRRLLLDFILNFCTWLSRQWAILIGFFTLNWLELKENHNISWRTSSHFEPFWINEPKKRKQCNSDKLRCSDAKFSDFFLFILEEQIKLLLAPTMAHHSL